MLYYFDTLVHRFLSGGGLDEDSSTELEAGSVNPYDSTDTFVLPTKKLKKYDTLSSYTQFFLLGT